MMGCLVVVGLNGHIGNWEVGAVLDTCARDMEDWDGIGLGWVFGSVATGS